MPKARPIQQIKQPQGNPNLPDTGEVVIDLTKAGPEPPNLIYGSSAYSVPTNRIDPRSIPIDYQPDRRNAEPVVTMAQPEPEENEEEDALTALKTAEKRAKERVRQLETSNQELQGWATRQAQEAAVAKHQVNQSNLDTVSSALAQAEGEAAAAEQAYADAWAKGDGLGVARANRAMNDAQYRINTLRAGKDELETVVRTPPQVQGPPQNAVDANVEIVLSRMTNLMPEEKDWIRAHPDSIANHNVTRLRVAYDDSQRRGLKRGSPEYFNFLADRLDYDDAGPAPKEEPVVDEPAYTPARRVSAPVSRSNGVGSLPEGKIRLTEAQRQAAKYSGISEVDYARGVQRLIADKKTGLYPNG